MDGKTDMLAVLHKMPAEDRRLGNTEAAEGCDKRSAWLAEKFPQQSPDSQ